MSEIEELQAAYDALETELRLAQQAQLDTPPGTDEWWALQRQIGSLRTSILEAEKELLEAKLAAGVFGRQGMENRLYFVNLELAKAARQAQLAAEYAASH